MMNLNDFEQLAVSRRAIRHFKNDPVEKELLIRLLGTARWAPSAYNLQPVHYVVVEDIGVRKLLFEACMKQKQIQEAPAIVVFAGDRRVVDTNLDRMIEMELKAGSMDTQYEKILRKYVSLGFNHAPMGLGWLWKATLLPFVRLVAPVPQMPAVYKKQWLTKQVMLSAMVFMLAAHAAGLATVPMEGFDERRVKRVLRIPRTYVVPLIVPVGYPQSGDLKKTRLPIEDATHWDTW